MADWVVLGHEPYGILAACLARRLGYSVLVIKDDQSRSWSRKTAYNGQDIEFGTAGIFSFLDEPGASLVFRNLLQKIFPDQSLLHLKSKWKLESGHATVATPEVRMALHPQLDRLRQEWLWELKEPGLPESGLQSMGVEEWRRFSAKVLGMKYRASPELKGIQFLSSKRVKGGAIVEDFDSLAASIRYALVDAQSGQSEDHASSETELLAILSTCRAQLYHPEGKIALSEILLQEARSLGVEVTEYRAITKIEVERGVVRALHFEGESRPLPIRYLLAQRSLTELHRVTKGDWVPMIRKLKRSKKPKAWRFSAGFTVRPESLPEALGRRLIWKEKNAPLVAIEWLKGGEVSVSTMLPYQAETLRPDSLSVVTARMFRLVQELFPFIEFYLIRGFPDFREPELSAEISEVYPATEVDAIPGEWLSVEGHESLRARGYESGLKNLYLSSPHCYPSYGQYGSLVSAFESVFAAIRGEGKEGVAKAMGFLGVSPS